MPSHHASVRDSASVIELPLESSFLETGAQNVEPQPSDSKIMQFMKRYRVLEFIVAILSALVALAIHLSAPSDREIPHVKVPISLTQTVYALDPSISYKMKTETVNMYWLVFLAYVVPVLSHFVVYAGSRISKIGWRRINFDTRDFLLSLLLACCFSNLVTTFTKNLTGRFRPCFYDMCGWNMTTEAALEWDGVSNLCSDESMEHEARRSFPSGHTSASFAGLHLLTLYLMGRSQLTHFDRSCIHRGGKRIAKVFLCFVPTLLATWVGISRITDNWHHYSDILAGALIGMFSAHMGYSYVYCPVFSEHAGVPWAEFFQKQRISKEIIC